MTAFRGAVDAAFGAFGVDAVYTPAGGGPVPVWVIARRPDTIVGPGETRIHAETAAFRAASERGRQPAPQRPAHRRWRDLHHPGPTERLVWTLDVRPA